MLNLGCGLDARVERVAPPASATWFDVDFPEVIAFRRGFFAERPGLRRLASPLEAPAWLAEVPDDRPAFVVADGVLGYLAKEEVGRLVTRLLDRLPHGEIAFDVMSPYAVGRARSPEQRRVAAQLRGSVDELASVDALSPRWRRTETRSVVRSRYVPLRYRLLLGLASLAPAARDAIRRLRYAF